MIAVALLKRAKDAGVTLWTDGGAIRYRGLRDALAWLVPALNAHKPAILAALACPAGDLIEAHLDYVQDLAVYAEERRQFRRSRG